MFVPIDGAWPDRFTCPRKSSRALPTRRSRRSCSAPCGLWSESWSGFAPTAARPRTEAWSAGMRSARFIVGLLAAALIRRCAAPSPSGRRVAEGRVRGWEGPAFPAHAPLRGTFSRGERVAEGRVRGVGRTGVSRSCAAARHLLPGAARTARLLPPLAMEVLLSVVGYAKLDPGLVFLGGEKVTATKSGFSRFRGCHVSPPASSTAVTSADDSSKLTWDGQTADRGSRRSPRRAPDCL